MGNNTVTNTSYRGGKGSMGVHQQIINRMPKHTTYIETHLGGGTILKRKKPSSSSIAIEIDSDVLTAFSKEYSTMTVEYVNDDCVNFLKEYSFRGDELVYSDPPYPMDTRKSKGKIYKNEYTNDDHIELLNTLDNLECFVMISSYDNELYNELLCNSKWYKFQFEANTRNGMRTETLWCNFNPDEYIKHDYSYIGFSYRERERIKRKSERWLSNLSKLDFDERNYILSNILKSFDDEIKGHLFTYNYS